MLMLSLASAHISNIRGILEGLTDMEKILYSKNGLIKYDYIYFEYALGHVYYIIIMIIINSMYTAELDPKYIKKNKKNWQKNKEKHKK